MTNAMERCHRPWWKRPPVWFITIAAALALLIGVWTEIEPTGKSAATPYSAFLDQLEAGNVASVTIQGTEIHGRFKHPLNGAQRDAFSTRAPDFGDPALIAELRKQHVVIEVGAPSPWTSVLTRIPWPMLVFLGVVLIAALVRLLRGGKAPSGSTVSTLPAHGMMGLVSGLFAKKDQTGSPPEHGRDEPKIR
ncbi:MAG: ATP-dependent metallopeptidase FtsH/Yme1/Tma family protein [Burkholderiales bacterium]